MTGREGERARSELNFVLVSSKGETGCLHTEGEGPIEQEFEKAGEEASH